jgi:cation/acetate symporter
MAAPLLARELGGTPLLGFIAAVAFATILAVVAGLTLSGSAALAHDLWGHVVRRGKASEQEQLRVARYATIGLALVAMALGIVAEGENVAFIVGLTFALAASANFPALVLAISWRRLTTHGAVASMVVGTVTTLVMIALSPTMMGKDAIVPLKNPGIVTVPLSFLVAIVVSLAKREPEAEQGFDAAYERVHLGGPSS